jgi:perosamine synthetase
LITYGKQLLDREDVEAVLRVLASDRLTQGPEVEKFESSLNTALGSRYACAVANGTAALHLIGMALGWSKDDLVITTPVSFVATANCILYAGAIPEFADIDPVRYTLDPNQVEDKIKNARKAKKNVVAIIAVDYAGHPADWSALRYLADRYHLHLVNDACHSLGASYRGNYSYAAEYADAVALSFHPVKVITCGEGGSILSNNSEIIQRVRQLRDHGIIRNRKELEEYRGPWSYEMHALGFNYRLPDISCALGASQLTKLNYFVSARRKIAESYSTLLENNCDVLLPDENIEVTHAYHLYPVQMDFDEKRVSKNQLFQELTTQGIKLQVHYIPIHTQPYYKKRFGSDWGDFPHAEQFFHRVVSLPVYVGLSTENIRRVVDAISSTWTNLSAPHWAERKG